MLKAKTKRERKKNPFYLFRHIPNKSLASNTCSKHDTIGANFAQEFKDHLFILASFLCESLTLKDAFRRPLHTDPKAFFHPNNQLQTKFFEPNDVSIHHVLLRGHYFFMEIVYIFAIGLTF